jgi:p-cumate 2,3-dioxygenase subunit alpha
VATANAKLQMRAWWRQWNKIMTSEELPPEPHDPLTDFYAGQRKAQEHTVVGAAT